jgi:pyruvate-formate lyase-activating enzyme
MFFTPSMELVRGGKLQVSRFERDSFGRTKRVHAYVTFGSKCNSKCSFCRNQQFSNEIMKDNHKELHKTLKKYSPDIHSMVFGGGEPLLYAHEIFDIITNSRILDSNVKSYIITNGSQKLFLEEIESCWLCRHLNGIMLSRHHYYDLKNAEIFGNKSLLTSHDIDNKLCSKLKGKMEFATTCLKGYIDSAQEIINFIRWGISVDIEKFLFNDLQKDVTAVDYWDKHQIDSNVFDDCAKTLISYGFKFGISVCYTAGYDITTYTKGDIRVGFKRYHQSKEETAAKWKRSKKYTYDLSIMPNGDIFSDWTNENKI